MTAAAVVSPPPVVKRLVVALEPRLAFELFTRNMARWWPLATYSCGGASAVSVSVEERVGGRVVEETRDGDRHPWGTVEVWDPPHRFAMTWHPRSAPEQATLVAVSFIAEGDGCRLELINSGWERRPEPERARRNYDGGWDVVLAAYARRAARTMEEL
jgi:hypothetical protein